MEKSVDIDASIRKITDAQHGVFAGWQVRHDGVTVRALRHREHRGWVVRLGRDLYRLRDHPFGWESQLHAALLDAGPSAAVARRSAARLHGIWQYRNDETVEVVVVREATSRRQRVGVVHASSWLPPEHLVELAGFRVTSLARTCFDLAGARDPRLPNDERGRDLHMRHMARVVNDALGRRGLRFVEEAAVLSALAKRGRPGTVVMRELLERFGSTYQPTGSDVEMLFVELIDAFGLPTPERQVPLGDEQGWIGTVDFLFRPGGLVVEIDSAWHDGPIERDADEHRNDRLQAAGYVVERFRYRDLVLRAGLVARTVRTHLSRTGCS
jgi:hypothetical protein